MQTDVLQYDRRRESIAKRVQRWTLRHLWLLAILTCFGFVAYARMYLSIRESHTKFWFDRDAQQRAPYTLFDANYRLELCLYTTFWPACAMDEAITGRTFEYDKW